MQVESKAASFLGGRFESEALRQTVSQELHDLYIVCDLFLNIVSSRPLQTMPGQTLSGNFGVLS